MKTSMPRLKPGSVILRNQDAVELFHQERPRKTFRQASQALGPDRLGPGHHAAHLADDRVQILRPLSDGRPGLLIQSLFTKPLQDLSRVIVILGRIDNASGQAGLGCLALHRPTKQSGHRRVAHRIEFNARQGGAHFGGLGQRLGQGLGVRRFAGIEDLEAAHFLRLDAGLAWQY